jgi:hypothetical protein
MKGGIDIMISATDEEALDAGIELKKKRILSAVVSSS